METYTPLLSCWSEYDILQRVVLCPPQFMRISRIINEVQKKYAEENIHTSLAKEQHRQFSAKLRQLEVDVVQLEPLPSFSDQVFTRDIAFTLGNDLFISQLEEGVRQGEEQVLQDWLNHNNIPYQKIRSGSIEGGDVLVDQNTVWVGDSGRTSRKAMEELRLKAPDWQIICLPFPDRYLHLDCVFNPVSPQEALIFPDAFSPDILQLLASRYQLIEVNANEQFTLGTNVLSLGNRTIFSLPVNTEVNRSLRDRGFTVIEVDLSEIIKSGGSFRCCTLPLNRRPLSKNPPLPLRK
ncbi:dimethylarginine dimethylaminohydrolase family protein [Kroppenstedtia pulmonis]|nr:dimethylarginine dimethylaminohydrolase family protein [Kroppenstedtia pulmonis]